MKTKITFLAVALMAASSVFAGTTVTDDFSSNSGWSTIAGALSVADGIGTLTSGGTNAAVVKNATYGSNTYASVVAYVTPQVVEEGVDDRYCGNDSGVLLMANTNISDPGYMSAYTLNYDPVLDKVQIIYNLPLGAGFANMEGEGEIRGGSGYGDLAGSTILRFAAYTYGSGIMLVGQGYDATSGAFLINVQCEVDGTIVYDSVAVPVLTSGISGIYANMNENEGTNLLITPSAVDSDFDDYVSMNNAIVGDANLDGQITTADFTLWKDSYIASTGDSYHDGDFNFQDGVTTADFTLWKDSYIASATGAAPTAGFAPEPTTMGLLAIGGLGVLLRRKK